MIITRIAFLAIVGIAATVFLTAGCSKKDSQSNPQNGTVANKICPIMEGEVDPQGTTVSWKGKTIGFCCDQCVPEWNKLSDTDRTAKLANANKPGAKPKKGMDHGKKSK